MSLTYVCEIVEDVEEYNYLRQEQLEDDEHETGTHQ